MNLEIQRYYLEINSIKDLSEIAKPSNIYEVSLIDPPDFQLNKFFYKQIGKNYRWIDRLVWNEKKWINYVNNSDVKTFVLKEKNNPVGYFEQILNKERLDCEIAIRLPNINDKSPRINIKMVQKSVTAINDVISSLYMRAKAPIFGTVEIKRATELLDPWKESGTQL